MKGSRIIYSAAEMAWLEQHRTMVLSDYHRGFVEAFGREDVSAQNLHGLRKRRGWKVGRAPGRMAGRNRRYSDAEMAWLKANAGLPIQDYHAGFQATFGRAEATTARLHSLRKRLGWKTGRDGRFAPGAVPPNKGKPCPPGVGGRHPNARKTQFKKGQLSARNKAMYLPIGSERTRPDGYVERKINDDLPVQNRWRFVHLIEWEAANGPLPDGHCLKCLDGDRGNTRLDNWVLIPRGVLPRLNGGKATKGPAYDAVSPEVRPAVLALARVQQQASQLRRDRK